MKKNILKKASAAFLSLFVALSFGLTAFADESSYILDLPEASCIAGEFLYDESGILSSGNGDTTISKRLDTINDTQCALGFYIGGEHRTKKEIQALTQRGAEELLTSFSYDGAFFIYLDYDGDDNYMDYMYSAGTAYQLIPDGTNGTFNAADYILYHARHTLTDKDYHTDSNNLSLRISYICDEITHFENHPEELSRLAEEQSSGKFSNPDSYILDSSEFLTSSSSNTSDKSSDLANIITKTSNFIDEGSKFSTEQIKRVMSLLEGTSQEIGFNLILYAGSISRTDLETEDKAKKGAVYTNFPESEFNSTVYLYIDLDGKKNAYDYMFASNDAFLYYTNGDDDTEDRISSILHAMQRYFPKGGEEIVIDNIVKGIEEYCNQLKYFRSKGLVEGIYYTDPETGEYVYASNGRIVRSNMHPYTYWWAALLIGIAAGALASVFSISTIRKRYRFKSSPPASMYTSQNKIYMKNVQDIFMGTHTTKVRIQSSSGGHGGGGGGGHVGGGGGGSHR